MVMKTLLQPDPPTLHFSDKTLEMAKKKVIASTLTGEELPLSVLILQVELLGNLGDEKNN